MKLKYLGTAAAERVPALFCQCAVCQHAWQVGGRDRRTQQQALLDDHLLLDFSGDSYLHMLQYQLDLGQITTLLITHWHADHFYGEDLTLRMHGYAKGPLAPLTVYGNAYVEDFYARAFALEDRSDPTRIQYQVLHIHEPVVISHYRVYPLPAQHGHFEGDCFIYAIQDLHDGHTLLYAHDTGMLPEAEFAWLAAQGLRFDLLSLDCTGQGLPSAGPMHMSLTEDVAFVAALAKHGLLAETPVIVTSHYSHNSGATYAQMQVLADAVGYVTAYDGLEVTV
ncbi:MBL fold metallo-hydrolase [Lacticaseibacillus jixiensis]|uniref:MBL fold metallo-hydrolase n=1 Tax=Lacticaseibacillus jixiensis TaxID=3231926 RepID=UPI0036F318E2